MISSAYRKYDVINIIHEDELWNKVPNSLKSERCKGFKLITIEVFFYGFGPNIEVNLDGIMENHMCNTAALN